MKKFAKLLALTLMILGSASVAFAQINFDNSFTNSANQEVYASANTWTKPARFMSDKINSNETEASSKKSMAAAYILSERYVFDHLKTLKQVYSISDIYFDLDQATIRQDATETLDKLAQLLADQPALGLAITAYCDSRMRVYNETMALKRAKAAKDYLITKGIDQSRLTIEKFGRPMSANPCNSNPACTLTEQQLNRRTEFNIIVNGENLARLQSFNE